MPNEVRVLANLEHRRQFGIVTNEKADVKGHLDRKEASSRNYVALMQIMLSVFYKKLMEFDFELGINVERKIM